MHFEIGKKLDKKLKRLKQKDKVLTKKIEKQLELFFQNHLHPSLRTHKLSGNMEDIWSITIDVNTRMVFFLNEQGAYFFDIGTHDQVYKGS